LKRDPKSLPWDAREAAEVIATITVGKTFAEFDVEENLSQLGAVVAHFLAEPN
jgi:hypothetical protein